MNPWTISLNLCDWTREENCNSGSCLLYHLGIYFSGLKSLGVRRWTPVAMGFTAYASKFTIFVSDSYPDFIWSVINNDIRITPLPGRKMLSRIPSITCTIPRKSAYKTIIHRISYSPVMASVNSLNQQPVTHSSLKKHCELIFKQGVEAVMPHRFIPQHLSVLGDRIMVGDKSYHISRNVYVIGFGKAVLGMAKHIDNILQKHIVKGIISVPVGIRKSYISNGRQ